MIEKPERNYVLSEFFGENSQSLVSHVPHATDLGMEVVAAGPCEVTLRMPVDERLIGDTRRNVVFGGVVTTLLDQVGGAAVMCALSELTAIATIDLRVDYTRAAEPGRPLYAWGYCYRLSRSVGFVRGCAFHEVREDPFANFLSTFMLAANPSPPGVLQHLEGARGASGSGKGPADV